VQKSVSYLVLINANYATRMNMKRWHLTIPSNKNGYEEMTLMALLCDMFKIFEIASFQPGSLSWIGNNLRNLKVIMGTFMIKVQEL